MSILNAKYTTHLEIMNRVSRVIKNKELNPADFVEWCQQVETELIMDRDGFYFIIEHELEVSKIGSQWQCVLPANVFVVKDVYSSSNNPDSRMNPTNTGTHLIFEKKPRKVLINYYGMPFQEEEPYYPLILKGHEMACEAYCKVQLFEEDFLMGNMQSQAFGMLQANMNNELIAATVDNERHKTVDDQDKIQIIRSNLIPNYGRKIIEGEKTWNNSIHSQRLW